ncbi:MAG: O-antigen ligase family protein [Armatimonadota bacterium]
MPPRASSLVSAALVGGLVLFVTVTPLLPTIRLKVDVTLLGGIVLLFGLYVRARISLRPIVTALDVPVVALLLVAALATIFSVDPFVSFYPSALRGEGWLVYVAYGLAALSAARLGRKSVHTVIAGALIGGSLVGCIALAQFYGVDVDRWLGIDTPPPHFGRTYATLGNALFLGGYVNLLLPIAVSLAAHLRGRVWMLPAAASALLYGALFSAQGRSAWIAAAIATVLVVALLPKSLETFRRLAVLAAVFAVMTAVLVVTRPSPRLAGRAAATFNLRDPSFQQRLYVWKHTAPLIARRPVLGWGFGALLGRFPDAGSREWQRHFGLSIVGIDTPHNEVLHFAFSIGLIGLAAYLWVWLVIGRSLRSALREHGESPAPAEGNLALSVGLLASMAGYALWLQLAWSHMGPANVFWPLAGVIVALGRSSGAEGAVSMRTRLPAPGRQLKDR